jgi:hypothetical protein
MMWFLGGGFSVANFCHSLEVYFSVGSHREHTVGMGG